MPPTMTRVPLTLCTPSAKCPSGADKRSLPGRNSCSGLEKTATPAFACSFLVYSVGVNPYFNLHLQIWEGGLWFQRELQSQFGGRPRLGQLQALVNPTLRFSSYSAHILCNYFDGGGQSFACSW